MDNEFGEYLRYLRNNRSPVVTQEGLSKVIGRGKITISQFEQGKNFPPQDNLLSRIIKALKFSPATTLFIISSLSSIGILLYLLIFLFYCFPYTVALAT